MPITEVAIKTTKKSKKQSIPEINIKGKSIFLYNAADRQEKNAKKANKPSILNEALTPIFVQNIKADSSEAEAPASVILVDERGAKARVTMAATYSVPDIAAVEDTFKDLKVDPGLYVTGGLTAQFDPSVFNDPVTGNFSKDIFDRFNRALTRAAKAVEAELKAEGVDVVIPNPLSVGKTYYVKPEFHAERFKKFNLDENQALQTALPVQLRVTALQ